MSSQKRTPEKDSTDTSTAIAEPPAEANKDGPAPPGLDKRNRYPSPIRSE